MNHPEHFDMPQAEPPQIPKIKSYKTVCFKLGLIMCVYYVCRIAATFILILTVDRLSGTLSYIVTWSAQLVFIYIIPIAFAMFLFDSFNYYEVLSGGLKKLYSVPDRLAKNLGLITPLYGLTQSVNLITILVFILIPVIFPTIQDNVELQQFFERTPIELPQTLTGVLILLFMIVIAAPLLEEFLFRGVMYDALKPYGDGIAIIVTSVLFGLMHASIHMLFYATAAGFAFGYIRYATNSLFLVTILHLIVNAVFGGMYFILSLSEITNINVMTIETISSIYTLAILVFTAIGIFALIKRIPTIRKYRIVNNWDELRPFKKVCLCFFSISMIIMLILAIDVHANYPLLIWIVGLN